MAVHSSPQYVIVDGYVFVTTVLHEPRFTCVRTHTLVYFDVNYFKSKEIQNGYYDGITLIVPPDVCITYDFGSTEWFCRNKCFI